MNTVIDLFAGPGGWDVAADYPWQGNKTSQYRQVGDAIPPPLALAVLTAASGLEVSA